MTMKRLRGIVVVCCWSVLVGLCGASAQDASAPPSAKTQPWKAEDVIFSEDREPVPHLPRL